MLPDVLTDGGAEEVGNYFCRVTASVTGFTGGAEMDPAPRSLHSGHVPQDRWSERKNVFDFNQPPLLMQLIATAGGCAYVFV